MYTLIPVITHVAEQMYRVHAGNYMPSVQYVVHVNKLLIMIKIRLITRGIIDISKPRLLPFHEISSIPCV